ncbi:MULTISPECIES: DUF4310 family protein [unclassified Streptomyces]|uniref:DUF4310 family protein n=1 Tax=unclassified Streptomyces TaxID=2593676 RepID=UPI002DDA6062|nr:MULTISPECIES: DUF4310 family protein [unclassified Streptomyces]WSB76241.1 DUF4310 family protein [Streptomyces sp. NBC_01775]WSS15484.1 DUF4310 family protein [Streptomyces sp. NBC_01186]WSS44326.1 DUF4310 family protein [Streptomyces sp. NBC_01187]
MTHAETNAAAAAPGPERASKTKVPGEGSFWLSEWAFPVFVATLAAGIFAGTHLYYVYQTGAFNEVAVVALLKAGMNGGSYGAAAAFGAGFLFARIIEGPMVGILDIGGSLQTGVGIGIPAMLLAGGVTAPLEHFWLALPTGALIGFAIGCLILGIRRATINSPESTSTFGADVMMGAGNSAGRYLGPLVIIAAATASIPVGLGSIIGAILFYWWKKPLTGGAILGAMLFGVFFPIAGK